MTTAKKQHNRGFVLLFVVSLSSILLAISLGVANIAFKEVQFGTSARNTGGAFYAADSGVECAIFHDKNRDTVFPVNGQETTIECGGQNIVIEYSPTLNGGRYDFVLDGLGAEGEGCATVMLEKDDTTNPILIQTTIISRGYNLGDENCQGTQYDRVERELRVTYSVGNPTPPEAP